MARWKNSPCLDFLIYFIISLCYIYGEVKIQLKDRGTVDVPLNRDDIVIITFDYRPMASTT